MDSTTLLLIAILVLVLLSLFVRGGGGDVTRLRALERKMDLILNQLGVDPNQGLDDEIKHLAQSGQKIEAIKLYRLKSGAGLKDAKEYIEQHYGI
ncbi:MAG: hypothetical protein WD845_07005 [Pirellulales bacterium]